MITWRPYRAEDEAALRAAHQRQCGALGIRFAFPDLADPRYLLAEVAEQAGEVVGAVVAHATVEVMLVGANAAMVRSAVSRGPELRRQLEALGCDEAHAFVSKTRLRGMCALLRRLGFRRSEAAYVPFYTAI